MTNQESSNLPENILPLNSARSEEAFITEAELNILVSISSIVIHQHNVQAALEELIINLQKLIQFEDGKVYYHAFGSDQLVPFVDNPPLSSTFSKVNIPLHGSLIGLSLLHNQPYLFNNIINDPRVFYVHPSHRYQPFSLMCAPLAPKPNGEGWTIMIWTSQHIPYTEREFSLFKLFANYASIAIENAHLYQATLHDNATLQRANKIMRTINSAFDTAELYNSIAQEIAHAIHYERVLFWSVSREQEQSQIRLEFDSKLKDTFEHGKKMPLEGTLLESVLQKDSVFFCQDCSKLLKYPDVSSYLENPTGTLALLPLKTEDGAQGVMGIVGAPLMYSENDLKLLEILRVQFATALQSARVFERMNRTRLQWQMTLDAIPDTMVLINAYENTILQINLAAAQLSGKTPKELVGQNYQDVFNATDPSLATIPYDKINAESPSYSEELVSTVSGLIYQRSFYPIYDNHERLSELVIHIRDITETKFMQERLTQAARMKALGEMASGVAHDLNNTLATILGNVELLLLEVDDPNQRAQLLQLKQATLDSSTTVKRIQVFGWRDNQSSYQIVNLNDITTEIIELTRPRWQNQMQQRRIHINVSKKLNGVLNVFANSAEIKEVLTNLVFNALDAMPKGGTLTIHSWLEKSTIPLRPGEFAVLEVRDTGLGIPSEISANVFEPFFTTKGQNGTGLGLSMARQIINEHRGEIYFESEPEKGTTFFIKLPLAKAGEQKLSPSKPPSSLLIQTHQVKPRSCRILVIDDDTALATILARILERQGHSVALAGGGNRGLELFMEGSFEVVLTDLNMPEISGFEVARAIREINKKVIIAFITGWGNDISIDALDAAGIDLIIAKPYRIEEVHILMDKAIALLGR